MSIHEKLTAIQTELKAPKSEYNAFGRYKYRSFEGICEAVKPILKVYNCSLTLSDSVELIGERYYIAAWAELYDNESDARIIVKAYAREPIDKKGMDDSQITGTASSYARKYACNGLFLLDDTKDADTNEAREQATNYARRALVESAEAKGISTDTLLKAAGVETVDALTVQQCEALQKRVNKSKGGIE